jgi:putative spermidine/putrescine transport system ATP-binding protein
MTSYLQLTGISKKYGDVVALSNVDLGVEKGEFVTFLGPSGSGKTTTLMIVAGFEKATTGDVLIGGQSISAMAPHERNIGIVFQNYGLFPHKTAIENVYFPLQMRNVSRAAGLKKAAEMLGLVGLTGLGDRYPKELSGGQQQRVALARALVFEPSLLLLDEPLGALDKNLREQMQIEIKRIQRALGVTTIFVTHDQTEAMSMSDRIVVFDAGRIQQVATPLDIYHRPEARFVAGFIGESNLIEAVVLDAAAPTASTVALGEVEFAPTEKAVQGKAVTLMIRPEHMRLSRNPVDGRRNARMTIETIVNYGDNALVIGKVGGEIGGISMRVRVLGRDVVILKEGDECSVSWMPESVYLIGG